MQHRLQLEIYFLLYEENLLYKYINQSYYILNFAYFYNK